MVTTFLARGAQVHQAAMVSHLTPYDPAFQQRMHQVTGALGGSSGGGGPMAAQQAYGSIYGTLVKQSMLMSYTDNFRMLAFLCVLSIPTALLFKRVRARKGPVAVH
jgi:DHA2 family multidrug resistance protein